MTCNIYPFFLSIIYLKFPCICNKFWSFITHRIWGLFCTHTPAPPSDIIHSLMSEENRNFLEQTHRPRFSNVLISSVLFKLPLKIWCPRRAQQSACTFPVTIVCHFFFLPFSSCISYREIKKLNTGEFFLVFLPLCLFSFLFLFSKIKYCPYSVFKVGNEN